MVKKAEEQSEQNSETEKNQTDQSATERDEKITDDQAENETNEDEDKDKNLKEAEQDESIQGNDDQDADSSPREDPVLTKREKELQEQLEKLQADKDQLQDRFLRLQAEFDNFKKRSQREKLAERKYQSQELVTELLPALDNFERALKVDVTEETKSIIEGVQMIYDQIIDVLTSQGVTIIEAVGKPFDPNLHHAVMQEEDKSKEANIVLEELQKGYMLKDRVIRPTMVKVNK